MRLRVLSLCDESGIMVKPWYEAGHEVVTLDLQKRNHPWRHVVEDVRHFRPKGKFDIVFSFPPCTHMAVSGARWWATKGAEALDEGRELVYACCRIIREARPTFWLLENPAGRIPSTTWLGKASWTFHPHHFAGYEGGENDLYTKMTCVWTNFDKPRTKNREPTQGSKLHRLSQSPDRARKRSETPRAFARAVFEHLTTVYKPRRPR